MAKVQESKIAQSLREKFGAVIKSIKPRYEVVDPRPMAPPVGFIRQPSLAEQIRQMVQSERLADEARAAGAETFEEADDFYIEDDVPDPTTPYEANFDVPVSELIARQKEDLATLAAGGNPKPKGEGERRPAPKPRPAEPDGEVDDVQDVGDIP